MGEPALAGSTSPRQGEKVSYYLAVCLATGEVEVMELEGNSNSVTSAAFLGQPEIVGVEDAQVVDVPQQMCPAALVGAVIVMVGSIEVADQHASKLIAQDLVHHGFASFPSQEVPLGGCAEGPSDL